MITNIIHWHIKHIEQQNQIKLIIYYTRFKTSNLIVKNNTNLPKTFLNKTNVVYKFTYPFQVCLSENKIFDTYIGHTMTTLSCCLTYHLSDVSAKKQHLMTKHNKDTDQLKSSDIRKILINNTKIIFKI